MAKKKAANKTPVKTTAKKKSVIRRLPKGLQYLRVIAICENTKCGQVFTGDIENIRIGANARVSLYGERKCVCQHCGGMARIPEAQYTTISTSFFNSSDFEIVARSILGIQDRRLHGAGEDEIRKEISSNLILSTLAKFAPDASFPSLMTFLAVILQVIEVFLAYRQNELSIPHDARSALEAVSRVQPVDQHDIRNTRLPLPETLGLQCGESRSIPPLFE